MLKGTHLQVQLVKVIDGDTIEVLLPGTSEAESLRILALDTEESRSSRSKPETPWGKKAKERAKRFFQGANTVTIEFPGHEDLETCLKKYRGNFGRLLVYVYRGGTDFQQTMIQEGYSPYFMKYGYANFVEHHQRYLKAEEAAQCENLGLWDQIAVNGREFRNYALLGIWWRLRAEIIEQYRYLRAQDNTILNTRLDYEQINQKAHRQESAMIFTELKTFRSVGSQASLISLGSAAQPFSLFIPETNSAQGEKIINLLKNRYLSSQDHPKRSYAYISGNLSTFRDRPQMVLTSPEQIIDELDQATSAEPTNRIKIISLLPNAIGSDMGAEQVTLRNTSSVNIDLQGWFLQDRQGNRVNLDGEIASTTVRIIQLPGRQMPLNNDGDEVFLFEEEGKIHHRVTYAASDVLEGAQINFPP